MEALFFLIPLALIFCAIAIKAFFWAVDQRQFDNLDSAARSILFDDEIPAGALNEARGDKPPVNNSRSEQRDGA